MNIEDVKKQMATPIDLNTKDMHEKADILTLHFIGYLAKPHGICDEQYKKCLEAFNNNRGKTERENEAVLKILKGE